MSYEDVEQTSMLKNVALNSLKLSFVLEIKTEQALFYEKISGTAYGGGKSL